MLNGAEANWLIGIWWTPWKVGGNQLGLTLSYVRGRLIHPDDLNDEPLPRLPPLQGHLGLTCDTHRGAECDH